MFETASGEHGEEAFDGVEPGGIPSGIQMSDLIHSLLEEDVECSADTRISGAPAKMTDKQIFNRLTWGPRVLRVPILDTHY